MPLSPILRENTLTSEEEAYLEKLLQFYKNSMTRQSVIEKIKQWGIGDAAANEKPVYFATIFPAEFCNAKIKTLKEGFRKICEDPALREHWLACAKTYGIQCEQGSLSNFSLFAGALLYEHTKEVSADDKAQISAWCELIADQYHNFRAYKTLCLYALEEYVNLPYEVYLKGKELIKRLNHICLTATRYHGVAGLSLQILTWLHLLAVELKLAHRDNVLSLFKKITSWLKECINTEAHYAPAIQNACRKPDANSEDLLADLTQACGWQKKEALFQILANVRAKILQHEQSCVETAKSLGPG
jgi:hypothetical protein